LTDKSSKFGACIWCLWSKQCIHWTIWKWNLQGVLLQNQRIVITFEGKQQTLAESWSSSPRAPFHTQQPEKEFLPRKDDTSSI
jgi:hypothetical protein